MEGKPYSRNTVKANSFRAGQTFFWFPSKKSRFPLFVFHYSYAEHVIKVLRDNSYPLSFIRGCKSYHNSSRRESSTNGSSSASVPSASPFVVLPYVRGVSEKISRVLRNNGIKVGYKPLNVLRTCFPRPKDKYPRLAVQRCCLQGRLC